MSEKQNRPDTPPNYWLAIVLFLVSAATGLTLAIIPVVYWLYRLFTD
jgi:hypothetical protein